MTPTPRLSELTVADAGRSFLMRPGSVRHLLVPIELGEPSVSGPVQVTSEARGGSVQDAWTDETKAEAMGERRYRVEALRRGGAVPTAGPASWSIAVRGTRNVPEQTRDDTDAGWGERGSGHPRTWWEEQRPPHW